MLDSLGASQSTKRSRTARGPVRLLHTPIRPCIALIAWCSTWHLRSDTLLAVNEGALDPSGHWYPIVYEISVSPTKELETVNTCVVDFDLPAKDLKGFEGAEYIDSGAAGEFLLGLCEGNFCEVRLPAVFPPAKASLLRLSRIVHVPAVH